MNPDRLRVPGMRRPLRIYFFADTHLREHSPDDPLLADGLPPADHPGPQILTAHLERAIKDDADLILCGGDLFHFPSPENVAFARQAFDACPLPVWTVPGNHDWFYPGQDGWESLRDQMLPRLTPIHRGESSRWVRDFQGLRIIGLDNSTYFLSAAQTEFLERELRHPRPALVLLHIPLSTPGLRAATIAKHGSPILMADPEGRPRPGIDPAPTLRAADLLRSSPQVTAALAAHVHLPFSEEIADGKPQWIPEAGYRGGFRWIEVE